MNKIVFDSFALIALFRKELGFEIVRDLLVKIANDESEGFISAINVGEIYYMIARKSNEKYAEAALTAIKKMPVQIQEPDLKMCVDAASMKARHPISYADAFAATLAISRKAVLITGDREFESLSKVHGFSVKFIS